MGALEGVLKMTFGDRGRNARTFAAVVAAVTGMLVLCAGHASASRSFDSKLPEFPSATSVAFDAAGYAWITDGGHQTPVPNHGENGLYKYDPYPSRTLLLTPETYAEWPFTSLSLEAAVDDTSGDVLVAQANGRSIDFFDEHGVFSREWSGINGSGGAFSGSGIFVAVDNTDSYSRGRIYVTLAAPEDDVEVFDSGQRPVDFPATASYIRNYKLTGTPTGPFVNPQDVAVDNEGNIYVVDMGAEAVDEFASSGLFIRKITGAGVPGPFNDLGGVTVDPTNGNIVLTEQINPGAIYEFDSSGNFLSQITEVPGRSYVCVRNPGINPDGYLYVPDDCTGEIDIFTPAPPVPRATPKPVTGATTTGGTLHEIVDPNGSNVTSCQFEYGTDETYGLGTLPCNPDPNGSPPGSNFSSPTEVGATISGLTVETPYHYRVVASNGNGTAYGADEVYVPHHVVGLTTEAATALGEHGATLNGSLVGDGSDTHYFFEWGLTSAYGNTSAPPPGIDLPSPSGPNATPLSIALNGLESFTTYHYRIVATNGAGTSHGEDEVFTTLPGVPTGKLAAVTSVHADRAEFHAQMDPDGAKTSVEFEYVDDAEFQSSGWAGANTAPAQGIDIGMSKHYQSVTTLVNGLTGGLLYHYRAVGTNGAGTGSTEGIFKTFPFTPSINDQCPNAHVRQQTGTSLLLDCRAYELVSASNANGYDVESNLVAEQTPFAGYPEAKDSSGQPTVLYGVHDGGIPGTGSPTNHGVDPYVATRGEGGWSTRYVGIPATDPYASGSFASSLLEADASLDTFAFGGPNICAPCFADQSTGIPVHLPNGELAQGMTGDEPDPSAEPTGHVARRLSADGSHLVFGSTTKLEPDGSEGEVSIYDRNLGVNPPSTHVVSKSPSGSALSCLTHCTTDGIAELDISHNGSRIVIGQLLSEAGGSRLWHIYMDIGDTGKTVDLTPGTTTGALYDGMTEDGSKVFFTTADALTGDDTDASADIYEAQVTESGATLARISSGPGGAGNSDSCDPAANTTHVHWNTTGSDETCGVVAVGGGGGVASRDGTVFFLSPERLDTSDPQNQPVQDAPNLYVARPDSAPHFVSTLESSANAPLPPPAHSLVRSFGNFENAIDTAVDHSNGDIYVYDPGTDIGTGYTYKFDSSGHPINTFGAGGRLATSGLIGAFNTPTEIAVDNDPTSPNYRDLFIPDFTDAVINKFDPTGAHLATIEVERPGGVAVDPANGHIFVTGYNSGNVEELGTNGAVINSFPTLIGPSGVAVSAAGKVYVANGGGLFGAEGHTEVYSISGSDLGQLDGEPSFGVSVDPSDEHVYVDKGDRIDEFDPSGNQVGEPTGIGVLGGSIGLAADNGYLHVSNNKSADIVTFGPAGIPFDPETDNPLVVDSVSSPEARTTEDFQVTPSGDDAAFTSTLPLTGYDNAVHREVFRYDSPSATLDCASCNPTGEQATGEATLVAHGLDLTDGGLVFFNSTEGLADRDLNGLQDVYEWEPQQLSGPVGGCESQGGCIELITTGSSPLPSGLLSVSADGTDAYFFTRETLVGSDQNGSRVKLYDARAGGGFAEVPPPVPCKASDECHGAGTQAPPSPDIKSIVGTPAGNATKEPAKCKKGLVKKHGKCVRARHRHHRQKKGHRNG